MPFRNREYRLVYRRKWYAKNRKSENAHVKRRKLEIKKWFFEYKSNLSCSKCEENHPATLEFHHKRDQKKDKAIGNMVADGCSIKKILEEVKKCEVLCSNCHKKFHFDEKTNKI
jgi:hypothetical protein